jgi:hypothetical protein
MALLDAYERKARLSPGLLAFAPIAFAVVALGLKRFPAIAIALGVLSAAGGAYALSIVVAYFGRQAQVALWESWQGPPTTRFLRTRDSTTSPVQRDIWRNSIEKVTGVVLLSARQEKNNPIAADGAIVAAVDQIRWLGQDDRYPLVGTENIQYGFERNLYGFRWVGRLVSVCCLAALILTLLIVKSDSHAVSAPAVIAGGVIDASFLAVWIFLPSAKRTKGAAERYASQLFQAVVRQSKETQSGDASKGQPSP